MSIRTQRRIAAFTALALAATAVMPLQATAAPVSRTAPQVATHDGSTDFSARRYRRSGNAAALAMFGMVAGTIATVAINEQRRKRQRDYYRYQQGYYGQPGYYAPQAYYAPRAYYAPPARAYHRPVYPGSRGAPYFGGPGSYFGGAYSVPQPAPGVHN